MSTDDSDAVASAALKLAMRALGEAAAGRVLLLQMLTTFAAAGSDPERTLDQHLTFLARAVAVSVRANPRDPVLAAMDAEARRIDATARRILASFLRSRARDAAAERTQGHFDA